MDTAKFNTNQPAYANSDHNTNEISFSEIKQIIDNSNSKQYGFESALLEFILCRFVEFGEDHGNNMLFIFKKLFSKFAVKNFFESQSAIDITLTCFEYIHVQDDMFLPYFTVENFVKLAVADFFTKKSSKPTKVSLEFLVN